ncbi:Hydrolase, HIT [Bacillus cereus ATCC 10876]|nr:Hydrolase, HIT [Bacillus cereus ATCC 10876]
MMECLGCKLAGGEEIIYKIYEDDYVTCFLDQRLSTQVIL